MFCTKCGTQNQETNRFCFSCGAALIQETPPVPPEATAPPVPPVPPETPTPPGTKAQPVVTATPATSAQPDPAGPVAASGVQIPPSSTTPPGAPTPPWAEAPPDAIPVGKPVTTVPPEPVTPGFGPIAHLGRRIFALLLDSILISAILSVVSYASATWIAARWGGFAVRGFAFEGKPAMLMMAVMFLLMFFVFLYFWLFEGLFGATFGKMIMGIRVTDLTGKGCGLMRALVRNLFRIIDGLFCYLVGFLVALFSKLRQTIGDHVAKTVVTAKPMGTSIRVLAAIFWLGGIAGSGILAYTFYKSHPGSAFSVGSTGLKIAKSEYLESKDGAVRSSTTYKPGDKLYFRYLINGFSTDSHGDTSLRLELAVTDPDGLTVYQWKGDYNKKPGADDMVKGWFELTLPSYAPPGAYKVQIKTQDIMKSTAAEHTSSFTVDAPQPVVPPTLELRDVQLSLSDGGPPLKSTVALGNTIFMNGKLAGIQFAGDRINVQIAFQLIDPQGQTILDKPNFITINESIGYHPPGYFVPVSASVTLPPSGAYGSYTEKFVVTDLAANVSVTYTEQIEVQ